MARQPYLPLYTGDYYKDTRKLPLAARGAWVDLMIFMWDSPRRGVIVHTMIEYAQMMSCTSEEADLVIGLLHEKGICDFEIAEKNQIKLICRRMVRDASLSKKRSKAGKKGMESRYSEDECCYNKTPNKSLTSTDNDIDNVIDTVIEKEGVQGKPLPTILSDESLNRIFDEGYLDPIPMAFKGINIPVELERFKIKIRGAPDEYGKRDTAGIRNAFLSHLKTAIPERNGNNKGTSATTTAQVGGTTYRGKRL